MIEKYKRKVKDYTYNKSEETGRYTVKEVFQNGENFERMYDTLQDYEMSKPTFDKLFFKKQDFICESKDIEVEVWYRQEDETLDYEKSDIFNLYDGTITVNNCKISEVMFFLNSNSREKWNKYYPKHLFIRDCLIIKHNLNLEYMSRDYENNYSFYNGNIKKYLERYYDKVS